MRDAQCAETYEKTISDFCDFYFLRYQTSQKIVKNSHKMNKLLSLAPILLDTR